MLRGVSTSGAGGRALIQYGAGGQGPSFMGVPQKAPGSRSPRPPRPLPGARFSPREETPLVPRGRKELDSLGQTLHLVSRTKMLIRLLPRPRPRGLAAAPQEVQRAPRTYEAMAINFCGCLERLLGGVRRSPPCGWELCPRRGHPNRTSGAELESCRDLID